jgi:hypothetical protein
VPRLRARRGRAIRSRCDILTRVRHCGALTCKSGHAGLRHRRGSLTPVPRFSGRYGSPLRLAPAHEAEARHVAGRASAPTMARIARCMRDVSD